MVRTCLNCGPSMSTICRSWSGVGMFWTNVRPRSTSRCCTASITSETSSTTPSSCTETAPVSSPFNSFTSSCWVRVLAVIHRSLKASEAMNSLTCDSIRPFTAPASGPTRSCRRGRSVMTPANAWLSRDSTSTFFWIVAVTWVAIAAWTSGESTSGPTVSTYRWVSLRVRCPQKAMPAGVVSRMASVRQTTAAMPRPRESGLAAVGTAGDSDIEAPLGNRSGDEAQQRHRAPWPRTSVTPLPGPASSPESGVTCDRGRNTRSTGYPSPSRSLQRSQTVRNDAEVRRSARGPSRVAAREGDDSSRAALFGA